MKREQITLLDGRIDRDPYPSVNWTETLTDSPRYVANKPKFYNATGEIEVPPTKTWVDLVTPDTGDGYTIDISEANFSDVYSVIVGVNKATGTAADVPRVSVKSHNNDEVVVNVVASNTAAFVNTGVTLYVQVIGV